MNALLMRQLRDNEGMVHNPGESVKLGTPIKRATFDDRTMYNVQFSNGAKGALFEDEIQK